MKKDLKGLKDVMIMKIYVELITKQIIKSFTNFLILLFLTN